MVLTALLISFATLMVATAFYGCFRMLTEENASGPRSTHDLRQGWAEAFAYRLIALGNATREALQAAEDAALQLQKGIVAQADQLNARLLLRRAEAKAQGAQEAVIEQRLSEADRLLDQAFMLLEQAGEKLGDGQNNDLMTDHLRRSCRDTAICLRAHAAFTVRRMNRLLTRTELPVVRFEPQTVTASATPSSSVSYGPVAVSTHHAQI